MLLTAHIKDYQPRKVVQDFEVLREKGPELVIPFDEVQVVGRAYRDIGESERAYLVFRAIVEASYLEDAEVGEALRQRGRTLDATAYLIDLWRESPRHGVDRERLLRPLAGHRRRRRPLDRRPGAPPRAARGRRDPPRIAAPGDPDGPGDARPVAREPAGRRGEPGPARLLPRARRLRVGGQARPPVREALSQRARSSTASSTARPWASSRWAGTTAPSRWPGDRPGHLQGRQRPGPAQPEQVAGPLHPRPGLRRPPRPGAGRRRTIGRSPTASPTPPVPSRP